MNRGARIAKALGRGYDKLRGIFLAGICLQVLSGDQNSPIVEATYDSHWYLDRHEYSDLITGKKFILLKVVDFEGCRLEKLRKVTAVQVGNPRDGWERFRFAVKPTFIPGSLPVYKFKLSPTGERV